LVKKRPKIAVEIKSSIAAEFKAPSALASSNLLPYAKAHHKKNFIVVLSFGLIALYTAIAP